MSNVFSGVDVSVSASDKLIMRWQANTLQALMQKMVFTALCFVPFRPLRVSRMSFVKNAFSQYICTKQVWVKPFSDYIPIYEVTVEAETILKQQPSIPAYRVLNIAKLAAKYGAVVLRHSSTTVPE